MKCVTMIRNGKPLPPSVAYLSSNQRLQGKVVVTSSKDFLKPRILNLLFQQRAAGLVISELYLRHYQRHYFYHITSAFIIIINLTLIFVIITVGFLLSGHLLSGQPPLNGHFLKSRIIWH